MQWRRSIVRYPARLLGRVHQARRRQRFRRWWEVAVHHRVRERARPRGRRRREVAVHHRVQERARPPGRRRRVPPREVIVVVDYPEVQLRGSRLVLWLRLQLLLGRPYSLFCTTGDSKLLLGIMLRDTYHGK